VIEMLTLAIALIFFALLLLWQASRQQKGAGLPAGRVIYSDTSQWGKVEMPLFDDPLKLTGKPDYLVAQEGATIPVEVKSGWAPASPYLGHLFQLAAYCLLVERTYGKRPPYGILHYRNRTFALDYTAQMEADLLDMLAEIRRDEQRRDVPRSHDDPARCARCGYRSICDQSLQN
jgi:CRISPR-associated exonuclease Cas4